ncbi:fructose-specific PTS transporter subunit EIIC [Gulosibacter sp. 10]|uniref:PTS fructose transporter subunit IIABC n=1 Tax=Gulosibacter sp. 10 TaxID=1255570 RepID=UPI00097F6AE2|nr:fructose-specific PTS transporter subunit EIIC [Gulosibacter sp. 10]SJM60573.1 PTS system, fructose-specific IIA component / PTS system, fructose-specific IIB component / PTS system, fructose-specific IIC component [Gulosibacter sp. 10]
MTATSSGIITPALVQLDIDLGATKQDVIREMAALVAASGRADAEGLAADALAREEQGATGMGNGIAIPHCRSAAVKQATLAFVRLKPAVDFDSADGPADLAFMIAAPDGAHDDHLVLLARLAGKLVHADFLAALREATEPEQVVALVEDAVKDSDAEPAAGASADAAPEHAAAHAAEGGPIRTIIAVTACPTGIAHTFMAADAIAQAGKERGGVEVIVEPQGSSGYKPLPAAQIEAADAVILATDVGVRGRDRFAGKPGVESGVKRGVNDPAGLIEDALAAIDDPKGHRIGGGGSGEDGDGSGGEGNLSIGKRVQQALMTGVSYMIPFVAAGGLLTALAFLLGGYEITNEFEDILANSSLASLPDGGLLVYLGAVFAAVGGLALSFLVPALSAYIAYSLAGRPGIAPGFIGGAVAVAVDAGFLGGLVTGLLAGAIAGWIASWKTPRWLAGLMPVVIIPLLTTAVVGLLMYLLLGAPLAWLMQVLTDFLNGLTGGSAVLLGVILGLMMCVDLGGPVNKAAYLFATAGLSAGTESSMMIMAAVMGGGMVPPLALALATAVRGRLFTPQERENGRAAWLLGAAFISEGAIPFAATDPLRVIPSMMLGGAVTGGMMMAFETTLRAPHGGFFVFFAMDPIWAFALSVVVGMIVAAIAVILLKQFTRKADAVQPVAA